MGDIIKLKRARNSLLNIFTRVPPEILGEIFVQCLVWNPGRSSSPWDINRLRKGSYNFLLVCHHWFEVASHTPVLWSCWGITLQDWKKRYFRSGTSPLDLVLDWGVRVPHGVFVRSLQDAVSNRVMQGTIRQVHLRSRDGLALNAIIYYLTPMAVVPGTRI